MSEKGLINFLKKGLTKVSIAGLPKEAVSPSTKIETKSGVAWVTEGRIYVCDPAGSGSPATLIPGPGVELYVNGVLQSNQVPVFSTDRIELRLAEKKLVGKCQIELTEDKMEAHMIFEPTRIISYELLDQEPQTHLLLKTFPREKLESPFNLERLMKMLDEANVVVGVEFNKLEQLIRSPEQIRVTVARGEPPGLPVDERADILFTQGIGLAPAIKEDVEVNSYGIKNMIYIEEGALLARKYPGIPGRSGQNVCGEVVLPPPPRNVFLRADRGAVLSKDGNKVFAKKSGRPVLQQLGQVYLIQVEYVLVYNGDLGIKKGNMCIKGSLVLTHSNVHEFMTLHTTGIFAVSGILSMAKVIAYDNICIDGKAIKSVVSAGMSREYLRNILTHFDSLEEGLKQIAKFTSYMTSLEKVHSDRIEYCYQQKMLKKKLLEISITLDRLDNLFKTSFTYLPEEIEKLFLACSKFLTDSHQDTSEYDLHLLLQGIRFAHDYFKNRCTQKASLEVGSVFICRLYATGDIVIRGRGCFNTIIQAGGRVRIDGEYRGGKICANGSVTIGKACPGMDMQTIIEVGEKDMVRIHDCNEGVIIRIGRRKDIITGNIKGMVANLDKDGKLQINYDNFKTG